MFHVEHSALQLMGGIGFARVELGIACSLLGGQELEVGEGDFRPHGGVAELNAKQRSRVLSGDQSHRHCQPEGWGWEDHHRCELGGFFGSGWVPRPCD